MSKEAGRKKTPGCLIGIIAVVVLLVIGSGGGDDKGPEKVGTVASTESSNASADNSGNRKEDNLKTEEVSEATTEATTEEVSNEFVVGDIVATDDFKISYISAAEYSSDNQFIQPKDGHVFYRMEFEFENVTDSDQTVSSMLNWNCYADGYAMDQSWIGDDGLDATLSAGKKAKGALYFEVPVDAQEITLEYDVNYFSSDKIVFVVK